MSLKDWIDAVLQLLGTVVWPVVVCLIIWFIQSRYPDEIRDLLQRVKKVGPGGVELAELKEEVKTVKDAVKRIEEKIIFEPSTGLTPTLEQQLNLNIPVFRAYLQELGFKPQEGDEIKVSVSSHIRSRAFYDPSTHQIVIAEDLASKTDAAWYQYTYHALLPVKMEDINKISATSQEIEAGLALYFVCSFTNHPKFVPKAVQAPPEQRNRWDLSCQKAFKRAQLSGGGIERIQLYDGGIPDHSQAPWIETYEGEVWAAAFWQMRILLGQNSTDRLLFATWSHLPLNDFQSNDRVNFARKLLESAPSYGERSHVHQIQSIFQDCGLKF